MRQDFGKNLLLNNFLSCGVEATSISKIAICSHKLKDFFWILVREVLITPNQRSVLLGNVKKLVQIYFQNLDWVQVVIN
jgi:hypothetical protein